MAFRNVFQQARPALLEPVVKLAITVPEANVRPSEPWRAISVCGVSAAPTGAPVWLIHMS
jgi:hypothetical protein